MRKKALEGTRAPELVGVIGAERAIEVAIHTFKDGKEILEAAVYEKKHETTKLIARHFLDKDNKEYATRFEEEYTIDYKNYKRGEWSNASITSILSRSKTYEWYDNKGIIVSGYSEKLIEEYLGKSEWVDRKGLRAIVSEERDYKWNRMERNYQNKKKRIDEAMNKVEIIGQQLEDWVKETLFPEEYLFVENYKIKTGYRCRCTACQNTFMAREKPKHNTVTTCKKCKKDVLVKTRAQSVNEKKNVIVCQPYEDGYVTRHFVFTMTSCVMNKKAHKVIGELEKFRAIKSTNLNKYYWGQYRLGDETAQEWWDTKADSGWIIDTKFYMCPIGLDEANLPEDIYRILSAGAASGEAMNYNNVIHYYRNERYLEYIIKSKLYHLAEEIIRIELTGWQSTEFDEVLSKDASKISDLLQIDAQRVHRLREVNGGRTVLELLQEEELTGAKISKENLEFANRYIRDIDELKTYRTGLSKNKAINYIRKLMNRSGHKYSHVTQTYKDYLNMAAERGMDLQDDIVRLNPRMFEFHDRYVEEKNLKADKDRARKLAKKFPNIKKEYKKNKELMAWETEGYVILVPETVKDIIDEGRRQHHCVAASDTYFEKMNKRESFIVFLRHKESKDVPYYTIELKLTAQGVEILQNYAAYDRKPDEAEVKKILNKYKAAVKKRLKVS